MRNPVEGRSPSAWFLRCCATLALSLSLVSACGSDDDAARPTAGGQTGSLTCEILTRSARLPSGDVAGVAATGKCPVQAGDIVVLDAEGRSVPVTLEPLDDGRYVIRADEALAPGNYQVKLHGKSAELVVDEVTPLPDQLGEIRSVTTDCDGAYVSMQLSEAARAYHSLLRLSVSVSGEPPRLAAEVGELQPNSHGEVSLWFARCADGGCWGTGEQSLKFTAEIAGEEADIAPLEGRFEETCSLEDDRLTCALPQKPHARNLGIAGLFGVLGAALWCRRRRVSCSGRARQKVTPSSSDSEP